MRSKYFRNKASGRKTPLLLAMMVSVFCTSQLFAQTTFNYTGALQTYTVPAGVFSLTIDVYGAQGGNISNVYGTTFGGLGGYATGTLAVTPGQVLTIYVGGQGATEGVAGGGFNGGGVAAPNYGAGGGGASDVRIGAAALSDRVIVGGGGGGCTCGSCPVNGGDGGGSTGGSGISACGFTTGTGGTQVSGGNDACCYGNSNGLVTAGFGFGASPSDYHNAGGGGGWYGGGGGAGHASASGGSSYIGGVTAGSTVPGLRTGDGMVVISAGVVSNLPPNAVCQNLSLNADASCEANAVASDFNNGSTDPESDPLTFSVFPTGPYPLGITNVVFTANDGTSNSTCSATITVNDVTAPVITCPANSTIPADSGSCGAVVIYSLPTATDNCGGGGSGLAYYIRSNAVGGEPWGSNSNIDAMDAVYGAGMWMSEYFETAVAGSVFSAGTKVVFLEGSDAHADELNAFLTANLPAMEAWVNNGGTLFINAAPNESGNINFGFSGTLLNYDGGATTMCDGPVDAVTPTDPIFIGPYTPIATSYTGTSFSHAAITGTGLTNLLQGCGMIQLATKSWGAGNVFFGGMTTTNWHSPNPEAQNLRQNIVYFLDNIGSGPSIIQTSGLPSGSVFPVGVTTNTFQATDGSGNSSTCAFTVTVSDNIAPTPDAASLPTLTGCSVTVSVVPTASDTCSGVVNGTTTDPLTYITPGNFTVTWSYTDGNGNTSTQTQSINVIDCSGVENVNGINFSLYPNPSNGIFTLNLSKMPATGAEIRLLNELGQVLYTNSIQNISQNYDFSYLKAATYYVQIIGNDVNVTKTIIVTHKN